MGGFSSTSPPLANGSMSQPTPALGSVSGGGNSVPMPGMLGGSVGGPPQAPLNGTQNAMVDNSGVMAGAGAPAWLSRVPPQLQGYYRQQLLANPTMQPPLMYVNPTATAGGGTYRPAQPAPPVSNTPQPMGRR